MVGEFVEELLFSPSRRRVGAGLRENCSEELQSRIQPVNPFLRELTAQPVLGLQQKIRVSVFEIAQGL